MVIGMCKILYFLPYVNSIKEKRQILNSIKEKIRNKFNVSISEVDFHSFWQKSMLGIVAVNSNKKIIDKMFSKILNQIEQTGYGYINDYSIEFFNAKEIYQ